ncbi:DUF3243 domain-containing protein [Wukongibacter sp. M2B1]|uniref:DUF3243 domain-containing protein n=1 Tax=Wukongibacter sp. M2B1 TaxID=3088895 RepID=UPI003D7A0003
MDLNLDLINDWDKWKETLSRAVSIGEKVGLSDDSIKDIGIKIGEFLSSNVDPDNHEQRLLKELFDVGSQKEREALTNMIIKMVHHNH